MLSAPMGQILDRLQAFGEFEVRFFSRNLIECIIPLALFFYRFDDF